MPETLLCTINDASQVGEARRAATAFARASGFDDADAEKAAIVTTELCSNLIKHANGGQLIVQQSSQPPMAIEILTLDKGAGIKNIGESLRDGFSTAGSAGQGLGAIQRLSSRFEIYSAPNCGTVIWCALTIKKQAVAVETTARFAVGAISLPHPKEVVCGDGWAFKEANGICQTLVVDGLGHGEQAAAASGAAIRIFKEQTGILPPVEMLARIHSGMRATRGAAVAVVNLETNEKTVRFAGVGNISGVVVGGEAQRQMVSHAGIVGYEARRMHEFVYPWSTLR